MIGFWGHEGFHTGNLAVHVSAGTNRADQRHDSDNHGRTRRLSIGWRRHQLSNAGPAGRWSKLASVMPGSARSSVLAGYGDWTSRSMSSATSQMLMFMPAWRRCSESQKMMSWRESGYRRKMTWS